MKACWCTLKVTVSWFPLDNPFWSRAHEVKARVQLTCEVGVMSLGEKTCLQELFVTYAGCFLPFLFFTPNPFVSLVSVCWNLQHIQCLADKWQPMATDDNDLLTFTGVRGPPMKQFYHKFRGQSVYKKQGWPFPGMKRSPSHTFFLDNWFISLYRSIYNFFPLF